MNCGGVQSWPRAAFVLGSSLSGLLGVDGNALRQVAATQR